MSLVEVLEKGGQTVALFDSLNDAEMAARHAQSADLDYQAFYVTGGFKGWRKSDAASFDRTDVVIVAHRTDASRRAAGKIVTDLAPVARSLRCLEPAEGRTFEDHRYADRDWHDLVQIEKGWAAPAAPTALKAAKERASHLNELRGMLRAGDDPRSAPSRQSLVSGWLDLDSIAMLFAPSDSYKSFVAIDIAMHVATGTAWNGRPVREGTALYVVGEGGSGTRNRQAAWQIEHAVDGDVKQIVWLDRAVNLLDPTEVEHFIEIVAEIRPALIVFDTLATSMPGGVENDSKDPGKVIEAAKRIKARTGACVLFVAHAGKDASRGVRGWSGLHAALDTQLELVRPKGSTLTATLSAPKQKDRERPAPLPLSLVEHQWPCPMCDAAGCPSCDHEGHVSSLAVTRGREATLNIADANKRLEDLLRARPEGITLKDAAQAMYGDTASKFTKRAATSLDALVEAANVTKRPGKPGGAGGGPPTLYLLAPTQTEEAS